MMEWILSSCVLIVVMIILRRVLKGKISLRLQYALWGLVLMRLLIPVNFGSSGISLMNAVEQVPVVQDVQRVENVDYIEWTEEGIIQGFDREDVTHTAPMVVGENKTEADFVRMEKILSAKEIFTLVWVSGSVLIFIVFALVNMRLALRLCRTRRLLTVEGTSLAAYVTGVVDTPCLFGLWKPVIYVTPDVTADAAKLRHTLAHEITHYRHKDHIWSLLRGACLIVHWFNPLVWWAASLSRNDAELACDEATIARLGEGERIEYGRTLINLTCEKRGTLLVTATMMTGSHASIKERIQLIAKKPKMALYTLVALLLVAGIAVGCTFTGAREGDGRESGNEIENSREESISESNTVLTKMDVDHDRYHEEIVLTTSAGEHELRGILRDGTVSWAEPLEEGVPIYLYERKVGGTRYIPEEYVVGYLFRYQVEQTETMVNYSYCSYSFEKGKREINEEKHLQVLREEPLANIAEMLKFSSVSSRFENAEFIAEKQGDQVLTERNFDLPDRICYEEVDGFLSGEEIEFFNQRYGGTQAAARFFIGEYFSRPEELNFYKFMYNFPISYDLKEGSEEYDWFWSQEFTTTEQPDWHYRGSDIDAVLMEHAGITRKDLLSTEMDGTYYAATDSYHTFTSDVWLGGFSPLIGTRENNIIHLYIRDAVVTIHVEGEKYIIQSFLPLEIEAKN